MDKTEALGVLLGVVEATEAELSQPASCRFPCVKCGLKAHTDSCPVLRLREAYEVLVGALE